MTQPGWQTDVDYDGFDWDDAPFGFGTHLAGCHRVSGIRFVGAEDSQHQY